MLCVLSSLRILFSFFRDRIFSPRNGIHALITQRLFRQNVRYETEESCCYLRNSPRDPEKKRINVVSSVFHIANQIKLALLANGKFELMLFRMRENASLLFFWQRRV